MKLAFLVALLGLTASTASFSAVIARTCEASLSAGVPMTQGSGSSDVVSGLPCSGAAGGSGSGPVGSRLNPEGSYSATSGITFDSSLSETIDSFSLFSQMRFDAALTLTSGQKPPDGAYGMAAGGVLGWGTSLESFSVSRPYSFSLEYGSPGSGVGLSQNFLDGPSGGTDLNFDLGSTGILTGMLLPGRTYSFSLRLNEDLFGSAMNGETRHFTESVASSVRLTAYQVPTPGTITLMLGGLGLLLGIRPTRRRRSAIA